MLEHRVGQALFDEVVWEADRRGLLSDEHFSVDGTLIEAVASIKSFRRRDEGEPPSDDDLRQCRGWTFVESPSRLKNETHESRTDPDCQVDAARGRAGRLGCHSWATP